MATYKVIQDIEAEDKILGPLTLRQFIYGLIAVFFLYICFLCISKGIPYLLVIFLPPALFTGFFAFPFGKDQSTEVWALAKIRFMIKPRRRIWDQSGIKELVTITVPKKVERVLTNGLSQTEVQSRLTALANTIDSRGWAVKNVNVNLYSQPAPLVDADSDRLINLDSIPREVPTYDVQAADDILDATNNPIAHQFQEMIDASSQTHRRELIDELNGIRAEEKAKATATPNDYWFLHQSQAPDNLPADQTVFGAAAVVHPGTTDVIEAAPETPAEHQLAEQFKEHEQTQKISYAHMRTIQPLGSTPVPSAQQAPSPAPTTDDDTAQASVTSTPNPAILSLASNNDLNVSTLAREAKKATDQSSEDEVVISLR